MSDARWPLSAPATSILLDLPPAEANPQPLGTDAAPVKLALQELLARGVLTMSVVRDGAKATEATLAPGTDPGDLPPALDRLHRFLRPMVPGALRDVLLKAHVRNPVLTSDLRRDARDELLDQGLIEERAVRRLGRRKHSGWARTVAGDALVAGGERQLERLREREPEVDQDPDGGIAALMAADEADAPEQERIELEGGRKRNQDLWQAGG